MCFSLLSGDWEHSVVKQSSRSRSASTLRQPASFCCSSSSSSRFRRTWADMLTPLKSELKLTGLGQQSSPHGPSETLRPGCASCRVVPSSALLAAASSLAPGEHSRHFEPPGCRRVSAAGAAVAQCPSSAAQPTRSAVLYCPQRLLISPNRSFASREIGTVPWTGRRLAQLGRRRRSRCRSSMFSQSVVVCQFKNSSRGPGTDSTSTTSTKSTTGSRCGGLARLFGHFGLPTGVAARWEYG